MTVFELQPSATLAAVNPNPTTGPTQPTSPHSVSEQHKGTERTVTEPSVAERIVARCRARAREALCFRSRRGVGTVFLSSGRVVHAELGEQEGLAALLAVLRFERFECTLSRNAFPERYTLTCSPHMVELIWQRLQQRTVSSLERTSRTRFGR